jgi:hypothetical protein
MWVENVGDERDWGFGIRASGFSDFGSGFGLGMGLGLGLGFALGLVWKNVGDERDGHVRLSGFRVRV